MSTPDIDDEETAHSNPLFSILGAIGSMAIFVVILWLAYLPLRKDSTDTTIVQERVERFNELSAKERSLANNYRWINEPEGVVRIPVERAMILTVERANAENE